MNYKKEIFNWHCENFFDFHKHLTLSELSFVNLCCEYDSIEDFESKFSCFTFSHRIKGNHVNSSRMGWGRLDNSKDLEISISEVLKERKVNIQSYFETLEVGKDMKYYGLAWDFELKHFKIYLITPLDKINAAFKNLNMRNIDTNLCDEGLTSITFNDKGDVLEKKIYVYDIVSAYMITTKRGVIRQFNNRFNKDWLDKLNKVGQHIVKEYQALNINIDTIVYNNMLDYTLYFED